MNALPRRVSVLIVDDEPENLDLLERTLRHDHDVHRASDGAQALAILSRVQDIGVIVTDQRMPGLTGTEMLKQARLSRPEAVRIIVTGFTSHQDLIDAINSSNVYRYVTKPWDVDQLQALVRRAVRLFHAGGGELLDDATGLPNRGLLRAELEREMARTKRTGGKLTLQAVAARGFSDFRALSGRALADALLVELADTLRMGLRQTDLLGVLAEGVFVAIISGDVDETAGARLLQAATNVGSRYAEHPELTLTERHVVYPDGGQNAQELLDALL